MNREEVSPSGEITLLIDGDVIAFTAASAAQELYEDEFGFIQPFASKAKGEGIMANMLLTIQQQLKATHTRIALTDTVNWRNEVWLGYKGNRDPKDRPLLLPHLRRILRTEHNAFSWPWLEADDVLGILNTEPQAYPGKRILVGKDKDFLTVPGFYYRIGDHDKNTGKPIVREVTEWEAQRFHLKQTLMGDAVDGYPGCPGLGKTRSEELLLNPVRLRPDQGVITRGVNKGNSTTKWVAEPTRDLWAMVVSHYNKAGQGETEALRTAQLAYILHHGDYVAPDTEGQPPVIRMWGPERIKQL